MPESPGTPRRDDQLVEPLFAGLQGADEPAVPDVQCRRRRWPARIAMALLALLAAALLAELGLRLAG